MRAWTLPPALAELVRRQTGLSVIEADFESFDFQGMDMDALLLIGALVHVPYERFQLIFSRIRSDHIRKFSDVFSWPID